MLELHSLKKNKVHLSDYPFEQDLLSRRVMVDFSPSEFEILEAILYSPLKLSYKKLLKELEIEEKEVLETLDKLKQASLLSIEEDLIFVDKEMRKCFEFESERFSPDFKPDMEFLQGLLKKVPIQVLPTWYSIPRTSDNIFSSILEKYLLTPQIYQRYLSELQFSDPIISEIMKDLFSAEDFTLFSSDVVTKYNLERREFEEILLLLEFHFVCSLHYERDGDHWVEKVTPFEEWKNFLSFVRSSAPKPLEQFFSDTAKPFAFLERLQAALCQAKVEGDLLEKLQILELVSSKGEKTPFAEEFLKMSFEEKALYLYRHPENRPRGFSEGISTEKHLREAEKIVKRSLHGKWTLFEEALKGTMITLSENSAIVLRKVGRVWDYQLPSYTEEEVRFIERVLVETLFEEGVVEIGVSEGKTAFRVTPFGRALFEG